MVRPVVTATRHPLPFAALDPASFEELCLWLIVKRYGNGEHLGAAGNDGGRDIAAVRRVPLGGDERVYVQCKRARSTLRVATLRSDVDKILRGAEAGTFARPDVIIFMATHAMSAGIRDTLRTYCGRHSIAAEFIGPTELDGEVGQFPAALERFFGLQPLRTSMPNRLPPAPLSFINREVELAALDGILTRVRSTSRVGVAVLKGMGGVGKSHLAAEWVHRHRGGFDAVLHVDLSGWRHSGAIAMDSVVADLLEVLNVELKFQPSEYAKRVDAFQQRIADRRVLLFLDGAEQDAHVRPLLPRSEGSVVIVTSQYRLSGLLADGARLVEVDPLNQTASREVVVTIAGEDRASGEPDAIDALVRACSGLPLLLSVCGAHLLGSTPSAATNLVQRLNDAQSVANALAENGVDVTAVFDAAYQTLPASMQREYRLLLGVSLVTMTSAAAAAALAVGLPAGRRACEALAAASLLQPHTADRWRVHDLIREHAVAVATDRRYRSEVEDAQRQIVRYYAASMSEAERAIVADRPRLGLREQLPPSGLVHPFAAERDAFEWWDSERGNMLACAELAASKGWHTEVMLLAEATWALAVVVKSLTEWGRTQRLAVASAIALGDARAEARFRSQLARYFAEVGDQSASRTESELAMSAAARSGDVVMRASVMEFSAVCLLDGGHAAEALPAFAAARTMMKDAGLLRGVALQDYYLARALIQLGDYDAALLRLRDAFDPFVLAGDEVSVARAFLRRAEASLGLDRRGDAADAARAALTAAASTTARFEQAQAHGVLAAVERRNGRLAEADRHAEIAGQLYDELGSPRPLAD